MLRVNIVQSVGVERSRNGRKSVEVVGARRRQLDHVSRDRGVESPLIIGRPSSYPGLSGNVGQLLNACLSSVIKLKRTEPRLVPRTL